MTIRNARWGGKGGKMRIKPNHAGRQADSMQAKPGKLTEVPPSTDRTPEHEPHPVPANPAQPRRPQYHLEKGERIAEHFG